MENGIGHTAFAEKLGFPIDLLRRRSRFGWTCSESFASCGNRGRGRPVDRDALENSGALSERFLDDVVAIAKELDGNAETLLTMLGTNKDPRLKGFRRSSADSLERYLRRKRLSR